MKIRHFTNMLTAFIALSATTVFAQTPKTVARCYGTGKVNPGVFKLAEQGTKMMGVYSKQGTPKPMYFKCDHSKRKPNFNKHFIPIIDCTHYSRAALANGPVTKLTVYASLKSGKSAAVVYSINPHMAKPSKPRVHERFRCIEDK